MDTFLITGAAGFVGARLVDSLKNTNLISVDGLACFSDRPEHRGVRFGAQVDRDRLFQWLDAENPTLAGVFHLGACTDTTELDESFLRRVNLEYSQQLWNYCARAKVPFYYASSAATYGDGAEGYSDEESLITKLKPLNPYGESKHQFDLWALAEEKRGNAPPFWSGFKFFNVYGYGERHKGKMSSVVLQSFDQIQETGFVRLFRSHRPDISHGHQKRDFIAVEDVISVLEHAHKSKWPRGIYNLGTGRARTFADLTHTVFMSLKRPTKIEFIDTPPALRERYQYFTEARVEKLRKAGYSSEFGTLEARVPLYVSRLLG